MKTFSFDETLANRKLNPNNFWCQYAKGVAQDDPASARNRFLTGEPFNVSNVAKFKFSKTDKIYTIGSCFARNVERVLSRSGFSIPTTKVELAPGTYLSPTAFQNTILNKYNPHSMTTEIKRGLGLLKFEDDALIEIGEDRWYDPQTSHSAIVSRANALANRAELNRIASEINNCAVTVITFGLTETWTDLKSGMAFNQMHPTVFRSIKDRIGFFNSRHAQIAKEVAETLQALKNAVPGMRVVLTVSPVPMEQTFTRNDVVAANTYSKATLRAVAQEMAEDFDFVDYFPSYEIVMNTPRGIAWIDDQLHPKPELVNFIMQQFVSRYVE